MISPSGIQSHLLEPAALDPDFARAVRAVLSFGLALLLFHSAGPTVDVAYIALTAQAIALNDFRGGFGLRLGLIVTMTVVMAASAVLGAFAGGSMLTAMFGMALVAVLGGIWRHLSADYGPLLSVNSALLFLIATAPINAGTSEWRLAFLVLCGGALAALLQLMFWLYRPQQPLRNVVGETWLAVSDLVASMRRDDSAAPAAAIAEREQMLRAALNRTFDILGAAEARVASPLLAHLVEMRREAVHFAMHVMALHSALESLDRVELARHAPTIDSVLKALSDAARSVAITLVTYGDENLARTELRLRRARHLIRVLRDQIASAPGSLALRHVDTVLGQIAENLQRIREDLTPTVAHSSTRFSEPVKLPEIGARSLRALVGWADPSPEADPVLIRYSLRLLVLTVAAVGIYKGFEIPRGYWIALTVIVVLQPDFGSTRQRAAERILGTFAGVLLARALLAIQLPQWVVYSLLPLTSFGFAFYLRRQFAVSGFFVTVLLVLLTEISAPVHWDFTLARLLSTVLGGGAALFAALLFWPAWERGKLLGLLAAALRANAAYLRSLFEFDASADRPLLWAKRDAEDANRLAAASLKRMLSEPTRRTVNSGRFVELTAYNQRLTRALTGILVHQPDGATPDAAARRSAAHLRQSVETLADVVVVDSGDATMPVRSAANLPAVESELAEAESCLTAPVTADPMSPDPESLRGELIRTQLAKSIVEVRAMCLALAAEPAPPASV